MGARDSSSGSRNTPADYFELRHEERLPDVPGLLAVSVGNDGWP